MFACCPSLFSVGLTSGHVLGSDDNQQQRSVRDDARRRAGQQFLQGHNQQHPNFSMVCHVFL